MIYFDNAATGGYKPYNVTEKVIATLKYLNANPGRSGHKLSKTGAELIYDARKTLSRFFNNGEVERVIFTKNCSEALNTAIYGIVKKGDNVITSTSEHNSTLRPLYTLEQQGVITLTIVEPKNGAFITKNDVENAFNLNTKLVAINYASNVTGAINDVKGIGKFLKDKNATFLVDGAQAGGHIKIDMTSDDIDVLCLAGHKGLYGIAGSGALIFNSKTQIEPSFQGGTGTETFNKFQPDCYPEKLEYGTLNLPSICSLLEGIKYIEKSLDYISLTLNNYTQYLIEELTKIDGVKVYSNKNACGIVAFLIENTPSFEVAETLSSDYDIAVRGGFHCAPLMHKFLKTENCGLVRVSLSPHNTLKELNAFIIAIKEIVKNN